MTGVACTLLGLALMGAQTGVVRDALSTTPASANTHRSIRRYDIVVTTRGLARALADAGVPATTLPSLDAALVHRLDVFAHAPGGSRMVLWLAPVGGADRKSVV